MKQWQRQLEELGYYIGEAGVDGFYGSDTEEATKKFQKDKEIKPDGIVGPNTWEAALLPPEMDKVPTAKFENLVPELGVVLPDIVEAYEDSGTGYKPLITSGNDGNHSENSAHYTNEAIDLVGYEGEEYTPTNYDRMSAEDLKKIAEKITTSPLEEIKEEDTESDFFEGNWDQNEDGAQDFRVLLEDLGEPNQHIHIDIHPENSIAAQPANNLPNNHVLEYEPGEKLEYDSYVEDWQERMFELGWLNNINEADGLYGPNSEETAREFQDAADISEDGKVGPETWKASFERSVFDPDGGRSRWA